jgi:hypothetical protein
MNPTNIPLRLWLIQAPDTWRNVALVESHTPSEPCDKAARLLGLNVGRFRSMSTESGRRLDQGLYGDILFAVNVTGILTIADAARLNSTEVAALTADIDDCEEFIAPRG